MPGNACSKNLDVLMVVQTGSLRSSSRVIRLASAFVDELESAERRQSLRVRVGMAQLHADGSLHLLRRIDSRDSLTALQRLIRSLRMEKNGESFGHALRDLSDEPGNRQVDICL